MTDDVVVAGSGAAALTAAGAVRRGQAVASIFGAAYPGGGATLGPGLTFGYAAGLTLTS